MLRKTIEQGKDFTNSTSTPEPNGNSSKNYMTYVNFKGNNQREIQREPDHVAMYTLNTNPHPNPKNTTSNNLPINRNPYINAPIQLRRDPPKQTLNRTSSTKQQVACRQSQQLIRNKEEILKSGQKSSSISSKGLNSNSLNSSINKVPTDFVVDFGYTTYNQTVDLGSISRNQSLAQSIVPQDELLKQKIQYIEFLQQSLRQFEKHRDIKILQNLNENNRLLLIKYFEEIGRQKEDKSRKTISDCVSESDNFSEDNFSTDMRTDSKNTSLRIQDDKNRFGGASKRDKSQEKQSQLNAEMRLNEKLERQYQQIINNSNRTFKEIQQVQEQSKRIQNETSKILSKNEQIKEKLNNLAFFQEWMLMSNQAEGARKTEVRLREELKKRRIRLNQLKQEVNKQTSTDDNNRKSQQTKSREKIEEREREGSISKNQSMKPMIPMPNRSLPPNQPTRVIQDSSLRIMGVSHQSRNKSINRLS